MALHGKRTLAALDAGAREQEPFSIGNVSGRVAGTYRPAGRLPEQYIEQFYADMERGAKYVFYSYGTPIAWLTADGVWVMPEVKYSVSTTGHQSRVRMALHFAGVSV